MNKIIILIAFSLAGAFVLGANIVSARQLGYVKDAAVLVSPYSLYVQNCARCHGSNGKAQTKLGRSLGAEDLTSSDVKEMSAERIARAITRGRGDMPAFGKKLNAKQIASIAQYVRSL